MILHLIMTKLLHLGILVDSTLNFAFHKKFIESKVVRIIRIISKLKHLMPTKTLLLLYHAMVHILLLYEIQIWGKTIGEHKSVYR